MAHGAAVPLAPHPPIRCGGAAAASDLPIALRGGAAAVAAAGAPQRGAQTWGGSSCACGARAGAPLHGTLGYADA